MRSNAKQTVAIPEAKRAAIKAGKTWHPRDRKLLKVKATVPRSGVVAAERREGVPRGTVELVSVMYRKLLTMHERAPVCRGQPGRLLAIEIGSRIWGAQAASLLVSAASRKNFEFPFDFARIISRL